MTRRVAYLASLVAAITTVGGMAQAQAQEQDTKAPAPLDKAAGRMSVPPGFQVTLFAGEPEVRQPIALTFDARGRLWVAECESYPSWEMNGRTGRRTAS